ncbi:DUF1028 domain-containing protein [uncultured Roseobacter sp.]|uniref:DUF1028 domain-containing protein n=1 Tax=uncultured Roseobacter sp. TaxID=114847 RepID=UPI0026333456|nr:DUF1028 domain-containing protein [uncultured Roseobacter sp.]
MTISILAYDAKSGTFGGAAATGSLCVGGWVLRGDVRSGLSASQGTSPSTLWGEDALALMNAGVSAQDAVAELTKGDPGRDHRQLSVLDCAGRTAGFTGHESVAHAGVLAADCLVVSGNMLTDGAVLTAARDGYLNAPGSMPLRLLAALTAAQEAGGDIRGFKSAALLQLHPDQAPLSLRIDYAEEPLAAMHDLYARATSQPYVGWTQVVPTRSDPYRSKTA